jgi:hypothetical protein
MGNILGRSDSQTDRHDLGGGGGGTGANQFLKNTKPKKKQFILADCPGRVRLGQKKVCLLGLLTIKTPNPKCRLNWCLIGFIN